MARRWRIPLVVLAVAAGSALAVGTASAGASPPGAAAAPHAAAARMMAAEAAVRLYADCSCAGPKP